MINPMMGALSPNMQQLKQMYNTLRSAGNPQALFMQMMQNNPQMQQVMNLVKQNGGDAKKAFYDLAAQKGVNPDDVINMLK